MRSSRPRGSRASAAVAMQLPDRVADLACGQLCELGRLGPPRPALQRVGHGLARVRRKDARQIVQPAHQHEHSVWLEMVSQCRATLLRIPIGGRAGVCQGPTQTVCLTQPVVRGGKPDQQLHMQIKDGLTDRIRVSGLLRDLGPRLGSSAAWRDYRETTADRPIQRRAGEGRARPAMPPAACSDRAGHPPASAPGSS